MKFLSRIPLAFGCLVLGGFLAMTLDHRIHGQAVPPTFSKQIGKSNTNGAMLPIAQPTAKVDSVAFKGK